MLRTLAALLVTTLALTSAPAVAQQGTPPPPPPPQPSAPAGKMAHLRLYLGGASANQAASGSGGAALLGIQGYTDILPVLQSYWGTELAVVRVGTLTVPLIGGDFGARFTPFPDWLLRPYVRANLGLTFILILPVPSAGVAFGLSLPIFNTLFFDLTIGTRRVFNVFNFNESFELGQVELSVGF